jgi:hypothetical protein
MDKHVHFGITILEVLFFFGVAGSVAVLKISDFDDLEPITGKGEPH